MAILLACMIKEQKVCELQKNNYVNFTKKQANIEHIR